ncbi:MAG TPA: hypothetical protein VGM81_24855 [Burkholderiaceae bacterium]|jgi:hypothetical protein
MAFTVHGFGTALYGQRNWRRDESYQTTKWFVVAFFPVFPIKTLRVLPHTRRPATLKDDVTDFAGSEEYGHRVMEHLPLSRIQVFHTYVFAFAVCAWSALMVWLFMGRIGMLDRETAIAVTLIFLFLGLLCAPSIVLSLLRRRAFVHDAAAAQACEVV